MIQHINKIRLIVIIIFSFFLVSCKNNEEIKKEEKNESVNSIHNNETVENKNIIPKGDKYVLDFVYFQSGGETDLAEVNEEEVVQKFKKLNVFMSKDTITIDNVKSFYKIDNMDSKIFFGRKYNYDYNINIYKNVFYVDLTKTCNFVNLDVNNNDLSPFRDYFLEGGDAIYEKKCLYLNYKRYIICFKKQNLTKKSNEKYSELPFDFEKLDRLCQRDSRSKYEELCNEEYPVFSFENNETLKKIFQKKIKNKNLLNYYKIKLSNNLVIYIIICEHEEESYGDQFIASIKDDKIVNLLDDTQDDYFHSKNFMINKDLTINIYENNGIHPKEKIVSVYKINPDGNFSKIK
ncbi:hypothetical protein [Flavobacterium oreochromis]|nr:hypothetical protein [Flavobacterium oreochromis]